MDKKDFSLLAMVLGALIAEAYIPGCVLGWPLLGGWIVAATSVLLIAAGAVTAVQSRLRWPGRGLCIGMAATAAAAVAGLALLKMHLLPGVFVLLLWLGLLPILTACFGVKMWQANKG